MTTELRIAAGTRVRVIEVRSIDELAGRLVGVHGTVLPPFGLGVPGVVALRLDERQRRELGLPEYALLLPEDNYAIVRGGERQRQC